MVKLFVIFIILILCILTLLAVIYIDVYNIIKLKCNDVNVDYIKFNKCVLPYRRNLETN
jgi:hypothetical protein